MASLKDLRNRIASVKATRKITKAMQMVAAAKLRRAQEVATAARPYADRMDQMMASLGGRVTDRQGMSPLLVGTGKDDVHLLVVMTGERGLAGGFNSNIAKLARGARLTELLKQPQFSPLKMEEQVSVIFAGTRGYLDPLPVSAVNKFEQDLLRLLRDQGKDILDAIRTEKALSEATEKKLVAFLDKFAKSFTA